MNYEDKHIILFDGVCNLCNNTVLFLIKRDKKRLLQFASLQSGIGQQLLKAAGLSATVFNSFVYLEGGKVFTKSTAVLKVLRQLNGFWRLFYIFIIVPKPLRDVVYDLIAKHRYRLFGRKNKCMVPTPELQNRFL